MSFTTQIYDLLRQVPKGKITTYKALAEALNTKAYQAVGNAMNKNPYAPEVPCHRVVKANGELGGFAHGAAAKQAMLEAEGISVESGSIISFKNKLYTSFKTA